MTRTYVDACVGWPAGHFGHSGHQIGKLLHKPPIENFPKPLSCPSEVSNPLCVAAMLRRSYALLQEQITLEKVALDIGSKEMS